MYTRLVFNSAPAGSSRCCFTACNLYFDKSLGRNRKECNHNLAQLETSPIRNEPCIPGDVLTSLAIVLRVFPFRGVSSGKMANVDTALKT